MKYIISVCLMLFMISCDKKDKEIVVAEAKTQLNVSYGSNTHQTFDMYLPANRSTAQTRVIILIHGGGWTGGDKKDFTPAIAAIQQHLPGHAIVNMNYRLVDQNNKMLPNQTDDIHAVINYFVQNAGELAIKPEFVLCGVSAGGHLSMLYAYKFDAAHRVKAVANIVGPTNLADTYYSSNPQYAVSLQHITDASSLPAGMTAPVYASPVTWVSASSAPTISFFGKLDLLVPVSQKTILDQKLNEFKVKNESHLYNGGHEIGGTYISDIFSKLKTFLSVTVNI